MTLASTGVGSPPHLTLELFQSAAGIKFVHVPYRGAAPALTDLLGGQVQVFAADAPVLMSNIKGGKIRALGAATDKRNPMLPDVPTLAEQGYPNTTSDNWYGLLAPAKTPPAVIAKINDAFVKAINDPVIKQKLIDSGAVPVADTPAEFGKFFKAEYDRWGKVVRERGIKEGGELTLSGLARYSPVAGSGRSVGTPARSGSLTRTGWTRSSSSLIRCHSRLNSLIRTMAPIAPKSRAITGIPPSYSP